MGPIICDVGIGARCVRKSSFVRGTPPKTGVTGKEANSRRPASEVGYSEGDSPPRPTPGMGQGELMSACAYQETPRSSGFDRADEAKIPSSVKGSGSRERKLALALSRPR